MFYSEIVLAKKGPLGKIWLAAHWDRRLTKQQILQTDIDKAVGQIIDPQVPMALRMCGHLLLGATKIYSRKVVYLLHDANEALVKIKMTFRPGVVDLPKDATVAPINAITLPEALGETELPDIPLEQLEPPEMRRLLASAVRSTTHTASRADITVEEMAQPTPEESLGLSIEVPRAVVDEELGAFEPYQPFHDSGVEVTDEFTKPDLPDFELSDLAEKISPDGQSLSEEPELTLAGPKEDQMTLLKSANVNDIFVTRRGTKRKAAAIDSRTSLSSSVMKENISNVTDIVREPTMAPPTKKAMLHYSHNLQSSEALFGLPLTKGVSSDLRELFSRNLTTGKPDIPLLVHEEVEEEEGSGMAIEETELEFPPPEDFDYNMNGDEEAFSATTFDVSNNTTTAAQPDAVDGGFGDTTDDGAAAMDSVSKNTKRMHAHLKKVFQEHSSVSFDSIHKQNPSRRSVAATFFELLVLKTKNLIQVAQEAPYSTITISSNV